MVAPAVEAAYSAVLSDKHVKANIDCVSTYLLGQQNHARCIRDVHGVLHKYIDLGVTIWSYWAFLIKLLFLAFNTTAIFWAFLTYKSPKVQDWNYSIPCRVVVWAEFVGICWFLLRVIWHALRMLWAGMRELCSAREDVYVRKLETCIAARQLYSAAMRLEFSLLTLLRYVSPPAVVAALARARRRVYSRYGTRVHRDNCCLDLFCCCCFYGRLLLCALLQSALVLGCAAVALLAVFIKVLQLRFLGRSDIQDWNVTEILLFGQFVVNMMFLDTRELSKRRAKLSLLFYGADAEKAEEERAALKLIENLALLVLRYRHSLLTAVVIHHAITSDDISYLYIQDDLEEDKPRNAVRHEYKKRSQSSAASTSSDCEGGIPRSSVPSQWSGPEMPTAGGYYSDPRVGGHACAPQVVVQMSPPCRKNGMGRHHCEPDDIELPMPPPPPPAPAFLQQQPYFPASAPPLPQQSRQGGPGVVPDRSKRFPYDFYSKGYAIGTPLR